jgi:ADP-ribose pyrophosphatase YjhB (NUDIX family)
MHSKIIDSLRQAIENSHINQNHLFGIDIQDDQDRIAASVMMLIVDSLQPKILLTLRSPHLPTHAGQVSFPGGVLDNNENHIDAAIREALEECGIIVCQQDVLGHLPRFLQ